MNATKLAIWDAEIPGWADEIDPFREKVDAIKKWRQKHEDKRKRPPSSFSVKGSRKKLKREELTEAQREEGELGKFLDHQKQARNAFLELQRLEQRRQGAAVSSASEDETKLVAALKKKASGMTKERLQILDNELPGWADEEDPFRANVQELKAYVEKNGRNPRTHNINSKKRPRESAEDEEAEDELEEEAKLGRFLNKQRLGRKAFLAGETHWTKLHGVTQERLDILDAEVPNWK